MVFSNQGRDSEEMLVNIYASCDRKQSARVPARRQRESDAPLDCSGPTPARRLVVAQGRACHRGIGCELFHAGDMTTTASHARTHRHSSVGARPEPAFGVRPHIGQGPRRRDIQISRACTAQVANLPSSLSAQAFTVFRAAAFNEMI